MLERVQAEDSQDELRDGGIYCGLIGIPVRACIFATSTVAERLVGPAETREVMSQERNFS